VALARAIESARPANTRLFADPFAGGFLDPGPRAIAGLCGIPIVGDSILWLADVVTPGARGNTLGRTRFIDDALLAAIHRGLDQVVILGAGYDCRPYRLAELRGVAVFEVDQPVTQARKRERLGKLVPQVPGHVEFVSIDFNERSLFDGMKGTGFQPGRRNFFIWEGVTEYLSADAVDATFRFVVGVSASGSALVFTYTDAGLIDGTKEFAGGKRLLNLNRLGGEPYRFGLIITSVGGRAPPVRSMPTVSRGSVRGQSSSQCTMLRTYCSLSGVSCMPNVLCAVRPPDSPET
jgi:methyltransferase (TIGR00027 family)